MESTSPVARRWMWILLLLFVLYAVGIVVTITVSPWIGLAIILPTIVMHMVLRATKFRRLTPGGPPRAD